MIGCHHQHHASEFITTALPSTDSEVHHSNEAPRCLPCNYTDPLIDSGDCQGYLGDWKWKAPVVRLLCVALYCFVLLCVACMIGSNEYCCFRIPFLFFCAVSFPTFPTTRGTQL